MQIPEQLQSALESMASGIPMSQLAEACAEISGNYREQKGRTSSFADSHVHRVAYAVTRMPAIYAANRRVMEEIVDLIPSFSPQIMLDLACGPGTASWAALESFPGLAVFQWLDSQIELLKLGKQLCVGEPVLEAAVVQQANLLRSGELPSADLVVFSYGLSELPGPDRKRVTQLAWEASRQVLVIIEPGTPAGFETILQARSALIQLGSKILAPCPHSMTCPMQGTPSWCHFAQRVSRSRLHRTVKRADMGYEDEKFSYLVASRTPCHSLPPRILASPRSSKHSVELQLCTDSGIRTEIVSRREKAHYRKAIKMEWGDGFELESRDGTAASNDPE